MAEFFFPVYIKSRYLFIQNRCVADSKLIAFWKNARILQATGLEFCQAIVSSIKRMVHRYILTGKIYSLTCTFDV